MSLAVNVVIQPAGRTFNLHRNWRFYLRSSPIVCAVDLLGFAIRWIAFTNETDSLGLGLRLTMQSRELRIDPDPIRANGLERVSFLRFVVFVLAAVQAIKLLGCGGIPWTKTWLCCYLLPFCFYELLGILVSSTEEEEYRIVDPSTNTPRFRKLSENLDLIDRWSGILCIATQGVLLAVTLHFLTDGRPWAYDLDIFTPFSPIDWLFYLINVAATVMAGTYFARYVFLKTESVKPENRYEWLPFSTFAIALFAWSILMTFFWGPLDGISNFIIPVESKLAVLVLANSIIVCAMMLVPARKLKSQILVIPEHDVGTLDEFFSGLVVVFFLYILGLSCLGYALRYDASTTFKPNWANSFG